MSGNGESALQDWVIRLSRPGEPLRVLDVGANLGRWSVSMIDAARRAGRLGDLDLHAFEPSSFTCAQLRRVLGTDGVSLFQQALGDQPGRGVLHVFAPGAGTNSLYRPGEGAGMSTEEITVTTLDAHARDHRLDAVTLVKIDTEGHDLAVLRGAGGLLAAGRIAVAQFGYNCRWIYARSFLRDAFELLEPLGYRVGKLTPGGVQFCPGWDPDLETFADGHYLACTPAAAARLPAVAWPVAWPKAAGPGPA